MIPTDEFHRLFAEIVGILVDADIPVTDAWVRAQAVVEEIRQTSKAVTLELTLSGIGNDSGAEQLRDRILNSSAFGADHALMLSRKALTGAKVGKAAAREWVY